MEEYMQRQGFKMILPLLSLLLAWCLWTPARGEPRGDPVDDLNFALSSDQVFVVTTTDIDDTIAYINLDVSFDVETMPDGNLQKIYTIFFYDPTEVELDEENYTINESVWDANFDMDIDVDYMGSGLNRVILDFEDPTPSQPPYETPTTYVTLQFKALCQDYDNVADLEFDQPGVHYVEIDNEGHDVSVYSSDLTNGQISLEEYDASYEVLDMTYHCGVLGKQITLAGVVTSINFRTRAVLQYIDFDDDKLEYVTGSIYDPDLWDLNVSYVTVNDNRIEAKLVTETGDYAPNFEPGDTLYTLTFNVIADPPWDGAANSSDLSFVEANCITLVYDARALGYAYYCGELTQPWNYEEGTVEIDNYTADLMFDWDCDDCDRMLIDDEDYGAAMVRVKNNFDGGGATNRYRVYVDYGDDLDYDGVEGANPDVSFSFTYYYEPLLHTNLLQAAQNNTGVIECTLEDDDESSDYVDLFLVEAELDPGYTPANYAARKVPIEFQSWYYGEYTKVIDETGNVTCRYGYDLTWANSYFEVPAVEFSSTTNLTSSRVVSQEVRLRNNFDVDDFSVTLTVNGSWCIHCVIGKNGATVTKLTDYSYKIEEGPYYNGAATGEDYKQIALVWYGIPDNCTGNNYYSTTPTLSDLDASGDYDGDSVDDPFLVKSQGTVRGRCANYQGGCQEYLMQYASPCPTGGITKEFQDFAENDASIVPGEFMLYPNRPNPFNPSTIIAYAVPEESHVRITVVNILGQKVATLVDENKSPGMYETTWNSTDDNGVRVSSGIYLYRMEAGDFVQTRKMIFMK
jgi:hypothetical protein